MSGADDKGYSPQRDWNVLVDPGDQVAIFDKTYFFERVDPDDAVEFRAPLNSQYGDFRVVDREGHPRKPTKDEIATLWVEGNFRFVEKRLGSQVRQHARDQGLDPKQARSMDKGCQFRIEALRRYDESPWSLSENALATFNAELLADPVIGKLPGARMYSATTWKTWIKDRGTEGCRKECDGISMRGRYARKMKIHHPLEIALYWAARATSVRGEMTMNYDRYAADIVKINRGEDLNRFLFIDSTGEEAPCVRPAVYPKPNKPYEAISYRRFARLCRALHNEDAYASQTTRQGAYQRFGGGGLSDLPTHLGAFCWIDDTPIPKVMFFDEEHGIPMGQCTLSLMLEHRSRVVPGWDIHPGAPSASTAINTVLSANLPKLDVPQHLLDIDPNLTWLRLKAGIIGFDNSTGNHSRMAEEAFKEAYITSRFFGADMPRDKSHMERIIGTFLNLVFKHMEGAHYDIERMRRFKFNEDEFFDPKKHVLISIQTARRLLQTAVMTYNVTRNAALDKRQPALVWKQLLGTRKLDKIMDEQALRDACCDVDFDMQMTNAGIAKFSRRYTPGALEMKRILQDFDRAATLAKGDIGHKVKHSRDDRKRLSFRVKGRFSREDIGYLRIWNPYFEHTNGVVGKWEIFTCTDPAAHGMPLWLHHACLRFAATEAMEYATPLQQAYVRAKLFDDIASTDAKSAERERLTLARSADHPQTKRVLGKYVHVRDEEMPEQGEVAPEEYPAVGHANSGGRHKDATIKTPRAGAPKKPDPATLTKRADAPVATPPETEPDTKPATTPVPETAEDGGSMPAPYRRRRRGASTPNDDRRSAGAHNQSADRPDQRARRRGRSNPKYGEE